MRCTIVYNLDSFRFFELQEDPFGIVFLGDIFENNASIAQLTTDGVAIYGLDPGKDEITTLDPAIPKNRLFSVALDDTTSEYSGLAADFVVGTPFPKGTILNDDTPIDQD